MKLNKWAFWYYLCVCCLLIVFSKLIYNIKEELMFKFIVGGRPMGIEWLKYIQLMTLFLF